MVVIMLLVVVALTLLLAYFLKINKYYREVDKIPGPSIMELVKIMLSCDSYLGISQKVMELNKIYGPLTKIWIKPFPPVVLISKPEYIEKVLMPKENIDRIFFFKYLSVYIGDGVATTTEENKWRTTRKQVVRGLNQKFIEKAFAQTNWRSDILIKKLDALSNQSVDIQHEISEMLLNTFIASMLDDRIKVDGKKIKEFEMAKENIIDVVIQRVYSIHNHFNFIFKHTSLYKKTEEFSKIVKGFAADLLQRTKAIDDHVKDHGNFIQVLLDDGMDEETVIDNINTIIETSHDTSAQATTFTLHELSKYPKIQEKVFNEILDIVGDDPKREITLRDVQKMKYLEQVVKESMRVNTVVDFIQRQLVNSVTLDNIELPKGTSIIVSSEIVHTSEEHYEDPKVFDPARFSAENETLRKDSYYLMFGLGPRQCLGKTIAMNTVKLMVAKMVRNFQMHYCDHNMKIKKQPLRKSMNGVLVSFTKRFQSNDTDAKVCSIDSGKSI